MWVKCLVGELQGNNICPLYLKYVKICCILFLLYLCTERVVCENSVSLFFLYSKKEEG